MKFRIFTVLLLALAVLLPVEGKTRTGAKKKAKAKTEKSVIPKQETQTPARIESTEEEKAEARESAHWYIPLNYGGFDFEIPAGSLVEKNSKVVVKYPDGSFGVSMENESGQPVEQKIAYEKAKLYAEKYRLKDAKVEKTVIDGIKGAKAVGMLEEHEVTVLILPVGTEQLTTVVMATPARNEWGRHFIASLKRP